MVEKLRKSTIVRTTNYVFVGNLSRNGILGIQKYCPSGSCGKKLYVRRKVDHQGKVRPLTLNTWIFLCNVADFALSRNLTDSGYYRCKSNGPLPAKWMAPESLERDIFNERTDVWSFGVTLWEILTRGIIPYATMPERDLLRYLKGNHRLEKFDTCPYDLFNLMRRCWALNAIERPNFKTILKEFEHLVERFAHEPDWLDPVSQNISFIYPDSTRV